MNTSATSQRFEVFGVSDSGISHAAEATIDNTPVAQTNDEHILGQYIPLVYHYNMLQDEDRVGAFREAIDLVVRPGMHVVELGGGTGILSSFAARRGASVTCVERNPELVRTARSFLESNGLSDRVSVVQHDASTFTPDRPVDAVICEMLHVGLLREKQAQVITAFKSNYAKAFGPKLPVFLPEASILMAQPVSQSFDFAGYFAPVPLFQAPILVQPRTQELSKLLPYASIAYDSPIPLRFAVGQHADIAARGHLNAIRFVTQNVIAIDLKQERAITWPNQCLVLPIRLPIEVNEGDTVEISFCYGAGDSIESLSNNLFCRRVLRPTVNTRNEICDRPIGKPISIDCRPRIA